MNEEKKDINRKVRMRMSATSMMRHLIVDGFAEIEDFHEFMTSAIKREKKLTSQRIEEGAGKLDAEQREAYIEFYSEDYQKIGGVFEKLALDSFVVMLYSQLEVGMGTLCGALRRDKQAQEGATIALKYTDLNGKAYIDRATTYIEKVIGISLDLTNNPEWREILALRGIRNAIVHESGEIRTNDITIKKHIKEGLIEIRDQEEEKGVVTGEIRVKSEYIAHIVPHARKFFEDIADMTKSK